MKRWECLILISFNFPQRDPTTNLTFNLRLSDAEREAKEKLALPFAFSKEKWENFFCISNFTQYIIESFKYSITSCYRKTAILHSGPGSGRILYEPDANDDYDQEDPDDDLDV